MVYAYVRTRSSTVPDTLDVTRHPTLHKVAVASTLRTQFLHCQPADGSSPIRSITSDRRPSQDPFYF